MLNLDPSNENGKHYGKAMMHHDGAGNVIVTLECATCGKVEIGPIPVLHLESIADMLKCMADSLGIHTSGKQEVLKATHVYDDASLEREKQLFNEIPMSADAGPIGELKGDKTSAWGLGHEMP